MRGATKDYDFGQKNHWRRTLWNEVLRRTAGREKSELVLYLSGPDDLDRKIAVAKGVPSINLVAVDQAPANVQSVRAMGNHAIADKVERVLCAWPRRATVCAVLLDFCHGLPSDEERERLHMFLSLQPAFADACIGINLLRGRDKSSESMRYVSDVIRTGVLSRLAAALPPVPPNLIRAFNPQGLSHLAPVGTTLPDGWFRDDDLSGRADRLFRLLKTVPSKHRGWAFVLSHAMTITEQYSFGQLWDKPHVDGTARMKPVVGKMLEQVLLRIEPVFFTYRSGTQRFDTAVFQRPGLLRQLMDGAAWSQPSLRARLDSQYRSGPLSDALLDTMWRHWPPPSDTVRKIAATLATRTRRMRAEAHD